eukprot:8558072-Pyramimonas_sp.AAC.1
MSEARQKGPICKGGGWGMGEDERREEEDDMVREEEKEEAEEERNGTAVHEGGVKPLLPGGC